MLKRNQVCKHVDTGRLMKVVRPRGFVAEAREPKGRTVLVSTAKLKASRTPLQVFRALD